MRTLAMIMAGGAGTRLSVLSAERAKPAVPFAGKYRIIDFTLSNCINSGIYHLGVLTQYRPRSLTDHIGTGKPWDLDLDWRRGGVRLLHPYLGQQDEDWYKGTADAVRQNLNFITESRADHVLILSGDHIYKMDYSKMVRYHEEKGADLTVAVLHVKPQEVSRFGIMVTDEDNRVLEFQEKPPSSTSTLASMGVYVFRADVLASCLLASKARGAHDFGKHIIPSMVKEGRVYAYSFDRYWVDVGTLHSYWDANLALTRDQPSLNLHDSRWVVHTRSEERPPVKFGSKATAIRSLVSNGCIIEGHIENAVLSPGVYVAPGAVVRDSVVMTDTKIERLAVVDRAIIDKRVYVGKNAKVGWGDNFMPNKWEPDRLNTGLTVVGKGTHIPDNTEIGRNCVLGTFLREGDFQSSEIRSGETLGMTHKRS